MEKIRDEHRLRFEELGESAVRLHVLTGGFPDGPIHGDALTWLSEREDASRSRSDVSQASQIRTALSAKNAAWIAAIAAIIAAIITIVGIIVTVLAWLYPRH